MARLAVDDDAIAMAVGERRRQAHIGIEAFAALIERGDLEIDAELDGAGVGLCRAGQQIDQRGLAGTVRAYNADAVAIGDLDAEVAHEMQVAVALSDVPGLDDLLAGCGGLLDGELDAALGAKCA